MRMSFQKAIPTNEMIMPITNSADYMTTTRAWRKPP
jgi:hypothetical protein